MRLIDSIFDLTIKEFSMKPHTAWSSCALVLGLALSVAAAAQNAPPAAGPPPGNGPTPAERAIEYRQALFTLVGGNFGPIGAILQGHAPYNAADVAKHAERVAFLATMADDAFPEISKDGKTKAKPEIWSNKEGFAKALKAFQDSSANLAALVKQDSTDSAAFKAAAGKVGESCKGCHDDFRAK
jgi:cytochrome c556